MASKKKDIQKHVVPQGFNDLDNLRVELAGFYSPQVESLDEGGDHVYGTLVKYAERRSPTARQAAGFIIVTLAAPVKGLIFDGDDDGIEGTLEAGWTIGIDIRGAYKMLAEEEYEGRKIHLHFRGKKEGRDGQEFWDVGVQCEGGTVKQNRVPPAERGKGEGASDDIPF